MNVPIVHQPPGSFDCQVACALMVLKFLGDSISYEELIELLGPYRYPDGMDSQGPMIVFKKLGYQAFFAHHDLGVIDPSLENCNETDIVKLEARLAELEKSDPNCYQTKKLRLDIEYINLGGQYSTKLPTLELVDRFLEKGIPVTLGVRYKALHLKPKASSANHAILLTGKEGINYFVLDPSPSDGGDYIITADRLLHAWYSSGVQLKAIWR